MSALCVLLMCSKGSHFKPGTRELPWHRASTSQLIQGISCIMRCHGNHVSAGFVFFNAAVSCLTRLYTEVTQNYTLLGKHCRYLAEVIKL